MNNLLCGQRIVMLTNRIGIMSGMVALAIEASGAELLIVTIRKIKRKDRFSLIKVIMDYGFMYFLDRVESRLTESRWMARYRRDLARLQVQADVFPDSESVSKVVFDFSPDVVLACGLGWRVPVERLGWNFKLLNLHPAPLPDWRGPDPVFWMLQCRETEFGITLHELAPRFDEGGVYFVRGAKIARAKFTSTIVTTLAHVAANELPSWIQKVVDRSAVALPQSGGMYWPQPTRANLKRVLGIGRRKHS